MPATGWTEIANLPPDALGTMFVLPNGTIMAQESGITNTWYQLTPDSTGSYVNGTWSTTAIAAMSTTRLYYGSTILPSGNVMVYGGEYTDASTGKETFANSGEIYDPGTSTWKTTASIPNSLDSQNQFGDDPLETLPNGTVLAGYLAGNQTFIYDPSTDTWSAGPAKIDPGVSGIPESTDEESWVKIPGAAGNILDYELWASLGQSPGYGNYLDTTSSTWNATGSVPVALSNSKEYELGPALLMPNGDVLQIGANGTFGGTATNTALYDPATNTWSAGPTIPGGLTADDAPGAVLPDGNVIFAADSSTETSQQTQFQAPTELFEYNASTQQIAQLSLPSTLANDLATDPAYVCRMLVLPTGQVAFVDAYQDDMWFYSEDGTVQSSWQPTITGIANNGSNFTVAGTQLTGMTEGAGYGDDAQMATNYPLVQLTAASGNVSFAPTSDWSSSGVQTGNTPVTTHFGPISSAGPYLLSVVASGISSNNVLFVDLGSGADNVTLRLNATGTAVDVYQNGSTLLGQFALSSFTAIDVNGSGAVTFDYSNGAFGVPIRDTATGAASDHLTIASSSTLSSLTYDATGANAGDIKTDGDTINFSGVKSLGETATVSNLSLNIDPGNAISGLITTTFTGNGAVSTFAPDNNLEALAFANPTVSLTVNGHAGNDHITFSSLGSGFNAAVTIAGNGGTDTVDLNTVFALGSSLSSGDLSVNATTINVGANINTAAGPTPGAVTLTGAVVMTASASITYGGTNGFSQSGGSVNLQGNTLTLTDSAGSDNGSVAGAINGSGGSLTKSGPGTLSLTSTSSNYSGTTTVSAGTLQVDGAITSSVTLNGGVLDGTGTTGPVGGSSGVLTPGDGGAPGILTTGGLDLTAGAAATFQLGGTAAGNTNTSYAQDTVASGTITLGATLNVYACNGFSPHEGDEYVLVNNQSGNAITTTFVAGAGIDAVSAGTALTEGMTLSTNFLGSGLVATLTYTASGDNSMAIKVSAAPQLGSLSPSAWTVNEPYSATITISGNPPFSNLTTSGLPPGLSASLSGSTITISGTPTTAGTYGNVQLGVSDVIGVKGSATYTIIINAAPTVGALSPAQWTVNQSGFSGTAAISNGTAPFSISAQNGLPTGLTVVVSGTNISFTGTPTMTGTFASGSVTIQDAAGASATATFSITINSAPSVGALTANQWTVNQSGFSGTLPISNGTSPFTVSASSGLPTGLSAVVSGTTVSFTGTPTATGTFASGSVTIKDLAGATATATFSITINSQPTIGALSANQWTVNQAGFPGTMSIGNGTSPFSISTQTGLPTGLTAVVSGTTISFTGTPSAAGTFSSGSITVKDAAGATVTKTITITINSGPTIGALSQTQWTVNQAGFTGTMAVSNGTGPFTITAQSGLPTGLTAVASGTTISFTGTPSAASTFASGSITIKDTSGATANATVSLTINSDPTIGALSANQWTVNQSGFNGTLPINNGTNPFTITAQSGLPTGLTAVVSGTSIGFIGTPSVASTFAGGSITIKDFAGASVTASSISITINSSPTIGALSANQWTVNQSGFNGTLPISNGTGPFTISAQSGLPAGLTATVSGTNISFTGTPSATGTFSTGSITVKDAAGALVTKPSITITINATPTIGGLSQTQWTVNQSGFTGTLTISNGTGPFTITGQSGLPTGLTAVVSGTTISFTGTPTAASTFSTGSISIKDAAGAAASSPTLTITINPQPAVSNVSVTQWTVNRTFPGTLTITSGTAPFSLNSWSGLPTGLTPVLSGTTISFTGQSTVASWFSGTISVKDGAGAVVSSPTVNITINPLPSLGAPSATQWTVNQPGFPATLSITGGTSPFSLTSFANLPTGLAPVLSGTTVSFTGMPTVVGSFTGSITVTDTAGAAATSTFTITINPPVVLSPAPSGIAPGVVGSYYRQTISAVAGTGTKTMSYSVTGTLPTGLNITTGPSTLTISGTPTSLGTATITVSAVDVAGSSASAAYTLRIVSIALVPDFLSPGLSMLVVGTPYSDTIQRMDAAGDLSVFVNGSSTPAAIVNGTGPGQTLANPTGRILVYGSGSAAIHLKAGPAVAPTPISVSAFLIGGSGNETLDATGSSANNVLVGGNGSNVLRGGSGRDILIGGPKYGVLYGGPNQDILLSGTVNYALNYSGGITNIAALNALMAEWAGTSESLSTRELNLQNGTGANGNTVLNATTIQTDVPQEMILPGSTQNWIINAPLLVGTQESAGQLTFSWGTVNGAASYQLLLVDLTAGTTVGTTSVTATAAQVQTYTQSTAGLTVGHTYRWYITPVTATNQAGLRSSPLSFVLV